MSLLDLRWRKKKPQSAPVQTPPVASQPIRVTDERDGQVINRGYAYYSACFLEASGTILAFCGVVGTQPQFFRVELNGSITRLGAQIPYNGEAEGWWFNPDGTVSLCDGPRLRRVHPFTGSDVVVLDISDMHHGHDLWQAHSSPDGLSHSATVREIASSGSYPKVGTVVSHHGQRNFYEVNGELDESHLDASGRWLIIEESNGNRVVDLVTGRERWMSDRDGALAHIDCGVDVAIGENDQLQACVEMNLDTLTQRALFATGNMGHISVRGRRCLHTDATSLRLIDLDSGAITPLCDHGMTGSGYDYQVHGNLDPTGRVAAFVSNAAGRMDLYVLRVP